MNHNEQPLNEGIQKIKDGISQGDKALIKAGMSDVETYYPRVAEPSMSSDKFYQIMDDLESFYRPTMPKSASLELVIEQGQKVLNYIK